jgi:Predicted membrane protein
MDYFERKQWIRIGVCTLLVIAATLGLTGVFGGQGPLVYDPQAGNGAAGITAEAAEKGFGGDVTVHVTLDGATVQALSIDTPDETEGLGKRASEEKFTAQFIGKEGPFAFGENGIEALSGATVTSEAALKALNRAVTGEEAPTAEAAPAEEAAAEEPAAEQATEAPAEETAAEEPAAEQATEAPAEETAAEEPAAEPETEAPAEETAAEEPAAEPETEAPAEETAAAVQAPAFAAYRADRETAFNSISVIASLKNGQLSQVKILSSGENDLLTDEIRENWAKAIVESGSAAPDAITGASLTFSSAAVTDAMNEILDRAGTAK